MGRIWPEVYWCHLTTFNEEQTCEDATLSSNQRQNKGDKTEPHRYTDRNLDIVTTIALHAAWIKKHFSIDKVTKSIKFSIAKIPKHQMEKVLRPCWCMPSYIFSFNQYNQILHILDLSATSEDILTN